MLGLLSCKKSTSLGIDVTAGLEKDAFTADPPVAKVNVSIVSLDGSVDAAVSTEPGGTFDFGNIGDDQQINIEVTGLDATGATVMRGRSLTGIPVGGVEGELPVFVQRLGQWARPTEGLSQTHVGGIGGVIGNRYVLVTGGAKAMGDEDTADPTQVDAFDLLSMAPAVTGGWPRTPESIATLGDAVLLIDSAGATWVDYSSSTTYGAALPTGLGSFADVAGGIAVPADDGRAFIVGGSRRNTPSRAVLEVAADGTLTAYSTSIARKGAAAVWIDTVGLVIAGGSAEGPGVEVLADGATAFAARGYPADPVEGAAAVTDGGKGVGLIGGTNGTTASPTRLLDPACVVMCTAKVPEGATPAVTLAKTTAYVLEGTRMLVVGDEPDGTTHTFTIDLTGGVTELPLKEPRRGATPVPTQLASLAILGGEHLDGSPATSVELFFTR
ncbi:Hypothetical protein A7982_02844 [Minicystis rosea]|nr:Hypothetical protein A7982_02844 [Minicystis rosea]